MTVAVEAGVDRQAQSFWVLRSRLGEVRKKIERLNRRARRLGCEPIVFEETGGTRYEEQVRYEHDPFNPPSCTSAVKFKIQRAEVIVSGVAPRIAGWELAARLEPTGSGNLVNAVPGSAELPDWVRTVASRCDHCRVKRYRKDVYALRNLASGEIKLVGSTCLADFLGHDDPKAIAAGAEFFIEAAEACGDPDDYLEHMGPGGSRDFDLGIFLKAAAANILAFGWTSRGAAHEDPGKVATADATVTLLTNSRMDREDLERLQAVADRAAELAGKALTWAQAIPAEVKASYLWNVRMVAHEGLVSYRTTGIAASIVSAYMREEERAQERERDQGQPSEHQGEVGKRQEFRLKVTGKRYIDGGYGLTVLHLFEDEGGNRFSWFASSADLEEGQVFNIKGTVKIHDQYKGVKRTVLTRCKVAGEGDCEF